MAGTIDSLSYSKSLENSYSVGICWLCDNLHFVSPCLAIWISRTFLLLSKFLKVISKSRKHLLQIKLPQEGWNLQPSHPSHILGWQLSITHLFGSARRQESFVLHCQDSAPWFLPPSILHHCVLFSHWGQSDVPIPC